MSLTTNRNSISVVFLFTQVTYIRERRLAWIKIITRKSIQECNKKCYFSFEWPGKFILVISNVICHSYQRALSNNSMKEVSDGLLFFFIILRRRIVWDDDSFLIPKQEPLKMAAVKFESTIIDLIAGERGRVLFLFFFVIVFMTTILQTKDFAYEIWNIKWRLLFIDILSAIYLYVLGIFVIHFDTHIGDGGNAGYALLMQPLQTGILF